MNRIIDAKQGAGLVLILSISLTAIFSTPAAAETVEFSEMKFEGGAIEESGNQTFAEREFEISID
jgi:hypothetical protein